MRRLIVVLLAICVVGCSATPGPAPDDRVDAHSLATMDRIDLDVRWSNAVYRMAYAVKAPCMGAGDVWRSCAIAHLVAVLPYGPTIAPYCRDFSDFARRFSCVAKGAAVAEVLSLAGAGDPTEFINRNGPDSSSALAAAERAIWLVVAERCTETAWRKGCARTEAAERLGVSPRSVENCAVFPDDRDEVSCLIVGRMSALVNRRASGL